MPEEYFNCCDNEKCPQCCGKNWNQSDTECYNCDWYQDCAEHWCISEENLSKRNDNEGNDS